MAVSDGVHLLLPFAGCASQRCAQALPSLRLPHLQRLLARVGAPQGDAGSADSLSLPHERALALACGLPATDGLIPLAALQADDAGGGDGWAWITPCHWRVARDHILMAHPQELQLDARASQAILALVAPYFAEDGITLAYVSPLRWLARGAPLRALPTASLDRVAGRNIQAWLPAGAEGRTIRRLQQEMQMLLYTQPLNEERERAGLLPVNSFWISGTGALPPGAPTHMPATLRIVETLRDAAVLDDADAWVAAWAQLDAGEIADLLRRLDAGEPVRITLCGEANSRSWTSANASLWRRMGSLVARPAIAGILGGL